MSSSHFDSIATVYDESLPAHVVEHYLQKRAQFVLEHCPRGDGLDVGCGTGVLAERLAGSGYRMVGVDPSEGMLQIMEARTQLVRPVQASGTSLPFDDDSFDLVITVAAMHHIADPDEVRQTLAEMVRVLKPSGRVVVWDHNPRNPYWGPLMSRVPQDDGSERLIPEAEIVSGLRAAGGRIVMSKQLGAVPDFIPPSAMRLAATLERAFEATPGLRSFAAHNAVVATK